MVDEVIASVGKKIVLATPLGIGKPNHLINAFYLRAKADPSIELIICTALTLQKPTGQSDLEKRFINLFSNRIFGDYPDLLYESDRMEEKLPDNIQVIEFYFAPGKYTGNTSAQRHYISSNYTHVVRDVLDRGVNVAAQMVSKREEGGKTFFSLSSNPDVTIDLVKALRKDKKPIVVLGQVNQNLPYMHGDAVVGEAFFDYIIDDKDNYYQIFGPPKTSVPDVDHMIGLYCSALIKDDGELQVGIGALGDATIYSLLLRHRQNALYNQVLEDFDVHKKFPEVLQQCGDTGIFDKGLFVASEMIVDGFRYLYEEGIVKKKVYDDIGLQGLINRGLIKEEFDENILDVLWRHRVIRERMNRVDFDFLIHWGILRKSLTFKDGQIYTEDNQSILPYLSDPANMAFLKKHGLGTSLRHGQVMHGGFFIGPQSFYTWLKSMPDEERKLINMKSVQKINQLYGHERLDRLHRKNARFINTCMMYTLGGAGVSDGLEDGSVVSGVGGQYNFVAMAQELPDGHSVLNLRSTRSSKGKVSSNMVRHYGHITIPRHLRDIVVTEYGIAMIRGKTDSEVIEALLNITDSRFQQKLLDWAVQCGKIDPSYQIPEAYTHNYPETFQAILAKYRKEGHFPLFPFGTDLTEDEITIGGALKRLQKLVYNKGRLLRALLKAATVSASEEDMRLLALMDLVSPHGLKEIMYKKLLTVCLQEGRSAE